MFDIVALREEFATLHAQTSAEATKFGGTAKMPAEDRTAQEKRYSRMDEIKLTVAEAERLAKLAADMGTATFGADPKGKEEFEAAKEGQPVKFDADQYKAAMNHYMKTGDASKVQRFAITTGTQSGIMLPTQVLPPVEVRRNQNAVRKVLGFYGIDPIKMDTPATFNVPISDDSANIGEQQAEGATSGNTADPSFASSVTLAGNIEYSSKQLWTSNVQIAATGFDYFAWATPKLMKRIDKKQESDYTTKLLAGSVGKTTASGTAITYAEVLAWEHSLPVAYRTDAAFILSDSLYQLLRGLVDNNNRPILDTDPTNVFSERLHGKPIAVSDYFQTVATGHKSGAFVSAGSLLVLDVGNPFIIRYVNVPQYPNQTGLQAIQLGDFNFDPNGVKLLAHT